uniref:Importin subunit alpha-4-like n=1 Tax=Cicer arietinum TaxID=3827 RepID=A0A3Q7Y9E3_CICAR|nr:importin subunit alpha-4-like [Cicer arietinum]
MSVLYIEQAAWVLGNISMDSLAARDLILDHGGLIPLASLLSSPQISDVFTIVPWTLANLCRKPSPPFQKIKPLLPVLIDLIVMPDEKVVRDACCALSCLSEGSDEMIEAIIKAGFIPRLVALLMHQSAEYAEPALRTIGNIVCGSTAQAQAVIDNRVLHCFYLLLTAVCHDTTMISEICWIISNITTDTTTQLEAVIDADLIRPLVRLTRAEFPIKKEAAWAISNACMLGTTEQIQMLVNSDCIIALCDLLSCSDLEVVVFCLEALENILSVAELEEYYLVIDGPNLHAQLMHQCGGWDKILNLLTNGNLQIFERSTQMLLRFWSEDFDVFCQNSRHYRSFSFGTKVPFAFIISPN